MSLSGKNNIFLSILLTVSFYNTSEGIKCFQCNSANNSACLDMHMHKMHAIVPVVDCSRTDPGANSKEFFCRKITQTILDSDRSPELRVTRGCGWVRHRRECYSADNQDHLETVCQCFGDMCNAAPRSATALLGPAAAAVLVALATWRGTE